MDNAELVIRHIHENEPECACACHQSHYPVPIPQRREVVRSTSSSGVGAIIVGALAGIVVAAVVAAALDD